MIWYIAIILLLLLLGGLLLTIAPWVPTRKEDLETIHEVSALKPDQTWLEIGSGTGHVSRYMAKENPKAKIMGLEILWIFWLWSWIINLFTKRPKPQLLWQNIFWHDLSEVDVIYVFSFPKALKKRFKKYLINNTKKGTRIISYAFPIPDFPGTEEIIKAPSGHKVYIYRK